MERYRARQCRAAECRLRFPVEAHQRVERCPRCGATTELVDDGWTTAPAARLEQTPTRRLEALLDNIRSLRNVGSMFRTADGMGMEHLHLAGITPTPDHPKLAKTALGAERSVPWTLHPDGVAAAAHLRERGLRLWALEGGARGRSLQQMIGEIGPEPIALVVGHEVAGVDPRILQLCERSVFLPMMGIKGSLNVSVAFGIATYMLRHHAGDA